MKASDLLEAFGDRGIKRVVLNVGTGGEIQLTEDDLARGVTERGATLHIRASIVIKSLKFDGETLIGRLGAALDPSTFVVDGVEPAPPADATEPMIGPDGEVRIGDVATAGAVIDVVLAEAVRSAAAAGGEIPTHDFAADDSWDGEGDTPCELCGLARTSGVHAKPAAEPGRENPARKQAARNRKRQDRGLKGPAS